MGANTYLKRHNKKRYFVDLKKNYLQHWHGKLI
jgi:hypothetical protein